MAGGHRPRLYRAQASPVETSFRTPVVDRRAGGSLCFPFPGRAAGLFLNDRLFNSGGEHPPDWLAAKTLFYESEQQFTGTEHQTIRAFSGYGAPSDPDLRGAAGWGWLHPEQGGLSNGAPVRCPNYPRGFVY